MQVIEETYRVINLWCRPLARTQYRMDEMKKKALPKDSGGSTSLLRKMREDERREAEASGILRSKPEKDAVHDEYTSSLSTTSESYAAILSRDEEASHARPESVAAPDEEAAPAPKPRRLKRLGDRVQNAIFDFSEIEQEKIEEQIDALVNADGYYNEVEPIDIDEDYQEERQINTPLVIAIIGFIIYVILIIKF